MWYVCHVEKNSVEIFETHALKLMFHSTQKNGRRRQPAAALEHKSWYSVPPHLWPPLPLSIGIVTLPPSHRPLHRCVEELSITSAAVVPLPSPNPPASSNRVREGMVITSRRMRWCFFFWWCGTARHFHQPPPKNGFGGVPHPDHFNARNKWEEDDGGSSQAYELPSFVHRDCAVCAAVLPHIAPPPPIAASGSGSSSGGDRGCGSGLRFSRGGSVTAKIEYCVTLNLQT